MKLKSQIISPRTPAWKFLLALICLVLMVGGTAYAYKSATRGGRLPGMLEEPVSIRQDSSDWRQGRPAGTFIYFGRRRSHVGGSYGFGK